MQRVTRSTAVLTRPPRPASPGPGGYFQGGDVLSNTPATRPGYEWFNSVQDEIESVILRSGMVLDGDVIDQMRRSLDRLYGGGLRKTITHAVLTADDAGLVTVDASGAPQSVILPGQAAAGGRPQRFTFARTDTTGNGVTIYAEGPDTIEGTATIDLPVGERLTLVSDGATMWFVLSRVGGAVLDPFIGMIFDSPGPLLPAGCIYANGQNISRTTYARLFAKWSTQYGPGDGSTTFGTPDRRGRVPIGRDDMGGSAASRITAAIAGFDGKILGAAGGDERLQAHGHGVNDPMHAHVLGSVVLNTTPVGNNFGSGGANLGITTGVTDYRATGISIQTGGTGTAQNVQPGMVTNKVIFTGVV